MEDVLEYMKSIGWEEDSYGKVSHPAVAEEFNSWAEAIIACIEIASGI